MNARHRLDTAAIPLPRQPPGRGRHVTGPPLPPIVPITRLLPLPGTPPAGMPRPAGHPRPPVPYGLRATPAHRANRNESTVADADTTAPSTAELWVRYHRKVIIQILPLLLAVFTALRSAIQDGSGLTGHEVVAIVLALAAAAGTYLPDNAVAKLAASGVFAIANGVNLAIDDHFTAASLTLIVTQLLAWLIAGVAENGARPDVVQGEVAEDPADAAVTGSGALFEPTVPSGAVYPGSTYGSGSTPVTPMPGGYTSTDETPDSGGE